MADTRPITVFPALVERVTTLADGGYRVSLDLPETQLEAVAALMDAKRRGTYLRVEVYRYDERPEQTNMGE